MNLQEAMTGPTNISVAKRRYGGGYIALIGYSHESTHGIVNLITDSGDAHEYVSKFFMIVTDYPYAYGDTPQAAINTLIAKLKDFTIKSNAYVAEGIFLKYIDGLFSEYKTMWEEIAKEGYALLNKY